MGQLLRNIGVCGLLLLGAEETSCAAPPPRLATSDREAPRSVDQAVALLKTKWLTKPDRDWVLRNPKDAVTADLHLPFGTAVRNSFGLWGPNSELLSSCGVTEAEACSGIIFGRLWESVRSDADPRLVHQLDCQFQLVEQIQIQYAGFYRLRIGEIVMRVRSQIDRQLATRGGQTLPGCDGALSVRVSGRPNLSCWSRAEFSEDGQDPVSLQRFLEWISWRNGFRVQHSPPAIDLMFDEKCAWPERPAQFQPGKAIRRPAA